MMAEVTDVSSIDDARNRLAVGNLSLAPLVILSWARARVKGEDRRERRFFYGHEQQAHTSQGRC